MTELEQRLSALAGAIEFPPVRNVAPAVTARIRAGRAPHRSWWRSLWSEPVAAGAVAVGLLLGAVLVVSPGAREAVADWLGVGGIRIEFGDRAPSPVATGLDLGERVTLSEARARAPFPVLVPGLLDLGEPDEVYFDPLPGEGQVSIVYEASPALPAARGTRVGLLVNEFRGGVDDIYFKKVAGPGTELEAVEVDGSPGFWIEGAPHILYYVDSNGAPVTETVRLAANVLLWEQGGVTFRVESALTRAEALVIAESLR